jgi:N-acetylglucosamine kinase-like BadF-type ATPase
MFVVKYVLGLDGGGSKVTCLAANDRGELRGCGRGGPVNTNYILYQECKDSATQAINIALDEAGLLAEQIELMVLSAPIDPLTLDEVVQQCKIKHWIRAAEGETSLWAARFWIDKHIGITVDAGTGSLSRGWARDGKETGAGGFGANVGDEGSGLWISVKAISAVLQAYDGRLEPTKLTQPMLDHFGISHVQELPFLLMGGFVSTAKVEETKQAQDRVRFTIDSGHILNQTSKIKGEVEMQEDETLGGGLFFRQFHPTEPLTRHEVASLCPIVGKVAQQGDRVAIQILKEAGNELGRLAVAVINRLGMQNDEFAIVPFGGVFNIGEPILQPFHEICLKVAPNAEIAYSKFEPEVGAVLIALNEIGVGIDEPILSTLEISSQNYPMCLGYRGAHDG